MKRRQIELVQQTFRQVTPSAPRVAADFYGRLFNLDPSVAPLFRETDLAEQGEKLMAMLALVVSSLKDLGPLAGMLQSLAARHAAYGVKKEHYPLVGEALVAALKAALGPSFTAEVEAAWIEAYGALATRMLDAEPLASARA